MLSRHVGLLTGHFNFNKDVLFLTNQRLLLAVKEKKTFSFAHIWNLEELPPVQFQRQHNFATTLLVAGSKIYLKEMNADSVGAAIEGAKANRIRALGAAAASERAAVPTVIREVHEKETVREVVKVPCRYCQQLNLMTAAKCSGCGAPLG